MNLNDLVFVKPTTALIRSRLVGLKENRWRVIAGPKRATTDDPKRDIKSGEIIWDVESTGPAAHLPGGMHDTRWVAERNLIPLMENPCVNL